MIDHYGEVDCETTKDVISESLMKCLAPMPFIYNLDQVGSVGEDHEYENFPFIIIEYSSPQKSLDVNIIIPASLEIKTSESIGKQDIEEQVHNEEIQEHLNPEVSAPLNMAITSSSMPEQVQNNVEDIQGGFSSDTISFMLIDDHMEDYFDEFVIYNETSKET